MQAGESFGSAGVAPAVCGISAKTLAARVIASRVHPHASPFRRNAERRDRDGRDPLPPCRRSGPRDHCHADLAGIIFGRFMTGDIRKLIHAVPFVPFTIHLAAGGQLRVPAVDHVAIAPAGDRVIVFDDDGTHNVLSSLLINRITIDRESTPQKVKQATPLTLR
jgi:hypothetical protein